MITLPINKLKPGMIICQSVFDNNGIFLLSRGTRLSHFYIQKLLDAGIKELAVVSYQTTITDFTLPNNIISESTRVRAVNTLSAAINSLEKKNILNMDHLKVSVRSIIREIITNRHVLLQIADIRSHDSYTLVHSVDTAILATFIGVLLKLPKLQLEHLALGAMLHDVGKTKIPNEILNKPGSLDDQEFAVIKKHPVISMRKLRDAGCYNQDIIDIALQHHEKAAGCGYPHHLKAATINPLAKIVTIADVYDALTSARPYKKAYKPHIAYSIMEMQAERDFDVDILKVFFDNVAIYPIGTVLKTTLGLAIVKKIVPHKVLCPTVCLFTDEHNKLLPEPLLIDLRHSRRCSITGVCDGYELLNILDETNFDPSTLL